MLDKQNGMDKLKNGRNTSNRLTTAPTAYPIEIMATIKKLRLNIAHIGDIQAKLLMADPKILAGIIHPHISATWHSEAAKKGRPPGMRRLEKDNPTKQHLQDISHNITKRAHIYRARSQRRAGRISPQSKLC